MNAVWSRAALFAIVVTACIYLISLSLISNPHILVLLKPLPIMAMFYVVWQSNMTLKMRYTALLALLFSILGDIALALPLSLSLELGIGFFFIAHCCYSYLLLLSYRYSTNHLICFAFIFLIMCGVMSILLPHLGIFRIPVIIYFVVLALMIFSALQVRQYAAFASSGALLFLISDSVLAFSLFVYPAHDLRFIIMLTYYSAQLLLTTTILLLYSPSAQQVRSLKTAIH